MIEVKYINDNNISLFFPNSNYYNKFITRRFCEPSFRKIVGLLIDHNYIDKNKNLIDSGSWWGDNAIPWSKMINGIVYAIDPSIENNKFAYDIAKMNNIENLIFITGALAGSRKDLYTDDNLDHCVLNSVEGKNKIIGFSIDNLYDEKLIDNISFIHLDIEGMEFEAVQGSLNIINDFRPIFALEQHFDTDPIKELYHFFNNLKYKIYIIDEYLVGCKDDCRNILCVPEEKIDNQFLNIFNKNIKFDILLEIRFDN